MMAGLNIRRDDAGAKLLHDALAVHESIGAVDKEATAIYERVRKVSIPSVDAWRRLGRIAQWCHVVTNCRDDVRGIWKDSNGDPMEMICILALDAVARQAVAHARDEADVLAPAAVQA